MTAIIDKAQDMNWLGMFKHKLLGESSKFSINERRTVILKKKISFIHKVSIILMDKLPNYQWDEQGKKVYLPRHKAMLAEDEIITGKADEDPEPTKLRRKEKAAASSVQCEAPVQETEPPVVKKSAMKRKQMASKPSRKTVVAAEFEKKQMKITSLLTTVQGRPSEGLVDEDSDVEILEIEESAEQPVDQPEAQPEDQPEAQPKKAAVSTEHTVSEQAGEESVEKEAGEQQMEEGEGEGEGEREREKKAQSLLTRCS